ncbi:DUF2975 domain-containing protein [Paenibacillus sp. OV219]|uniref:DUF2975 domain-containing protein n=1 Tax=Paenibacillus sp. OV219 TaxID=1884377 RepID=UPI0008AB0EF2|nr:DUF2975 domain-containing protein [Paenibacillus sp. OV219]SEO00229.1 Protein of unknown function [Paenibacillus sp. OV219]
MERGTTLFLKITVCLIGIVVLAMVCILLPIIAHEVSDDYPAHLLYPIFIVMYCSVVPFFYALYQSLRLLGYIDKKEAFSDLSVQALKRIKYCALTISLLYVAGFPFFFMLADKDDAPGLAVIGLVIIFASMVIAVFAAVLQKLLKKAIDIKSENDLTV